jgi:hypothetical protein
VVNCWCGRVFGVGVGIEYLYLVLSSVSVGIGVKVFSIWSIELLVLNCWY